MDNVNLVHLVIVTMAHSKANTESTSIRFHCIHHKETTEDDRMQFFTNIWLNSNLVHLVIVTMVRSKANTESNATTFPCMHH